MNSQLIARNLVSLLCYPLRFLRYCAVFKVHISGYRRWAMAMGPSSASKPFLTYCLLPIAFLRVFQPWDIYYTCRLFYSQHVYYHILSHTLRCFGYAMVGSSGLEPPTSRLSGVRSNRLSYEPHFFLPVLVFTIRLPISGFLLLIWWR